MSSSNSRAFFIILLASSFLGLGLFCDRLPSLIENYMKKTIDLATNDMIRSFWTKPPIVLPSYYWLYNITNPGEFLQGEKAMIQKVGPFYFTSTMEKRVIEISKNNYRITYNSSRLYSVNDSSVGADFDAPIWASNVILPSILSAVTEKTRTMDPQQAQMLLATSLKMAEKFNESILMRTTPRELLLGRKSVFLQKAVKLAETFGEDTSMEGVSSDGVFGLIKAQNGTMAGPFEVYTGYGETSESLGNIISVRGKQRSPFFPGACSRIQVSAGELRPFPLALNQTLEIYRPEVGRVLHLKPTGVHKLKEGTGISYVFSELDFVRPLGDPKRECYCVNASQDNYCSLNGAIELGPVQSYAPLIFTISTVEPDERIRASIANYSPDLLNSHVESLPDADRDSQFLILRGLGLPIKVDFSATIFMKIVRSSKTKSMTNIPETSYLPVVMQRERIQVPDAFLAPLANVNTLIELSRHLKVVFYVSAIFLMVPLTNLYYRQSGAGLDDADGELGGSGPNNNSNSDGPNGGNNNNGPGGGESGARNDSLGADARGSTFRLKIAGGKQPDGSAATGAAPFVLPVNIGNLTPEKSSASATTTGAGKPQLSRDRSMSINQVGCLPKGANGGGGNGVAGLRRQSTSSTATAATAATSVEVGGSKGQARYFSKLDEANNRKQGRPAGSELARGGSVSSAAGPPGSRRGSTRELNGASRGADRTPPDQNTKRRSSGQRDSLGSINNNNNPQTRRASLLAGGNQEPATKDNNEGEPDRQDESGEPLELQEEGQQGGPARRHRNWFVKVYADVVRVLNDIKRSISTASQLDISETSDVHDKQLEMLAGRIDNWYGSSNDQDLAEFEQPPSQAPAASQQTSPSGQAGKSSGDGGGAEAGPAKQQASQVDSSSDSKNGQQQQTAINNKQSANNSNQNAAKTLVNREAPIPEEPDAPAPAKDKDKQKSSQFVDHETQTVNLDESSGSSLAALENIEKAARDRTGSVLGGTGSESPVKSLGESALGLSVDIESTAEAEAIDKAVALQKLEQTIEKLEADQPDQADQLTGDLVDLSSLHESGPDFEGKPNEEDQRETNKTTTTTTTTAISETEKPTEENGDQDQAAEPKDGHEKVDASSEREGELGEVSRKASGGPRDELPHSNAADSRDANVDSDCQFKTTTGMTPDAGLGSVTDARGGADAGSGSGVNGDGNGNEGCVSGSVNSGIDAAGGGDDNNYSEAGNKKNGDNDDDEHDYDSADRADRADQINVTSEASCQEETGPLAAASGASDCSAAAAVTSQGAGSAGAQKRDQIQFDRLESEKFEKIEQDKQQQHQHQHKQVSTEFNNNNSDPDDSRTKLDQSQGLEPEPEAAPGPGPGPEEGLGLGRQKEFGQILTGEHANGHGEGAAEGREGAMTSAGSNLIIDSTSTTTTLDDGSGSALAPASGLAASVGPETESKLGTGQLQADGQHIHPGEGAGEAVLQDGLNIGANSSGTEPNSEIIKGPARDNNSVNQNQNLNSNSNSDRRFEHRQQQQHPSLINNSKSRRRNNEIMTVSKLPLATMTQRLDEEGDFPVTGHLGIIKSAHQQQHHNHQHHQHHHHHHSAKFQSAHHTSMLPQAAQAS